MGKISKTVYIEKHIYSQLEQISHHTGYTIPELIQNSINELCDSKLEELSLKIPTTPREKVKLALTKRRTNLKKWCEANSLEYGEVNAILHRLDKNTNIKSAKYIQIVDKLKLLSGGF